MTKLIIEGKSVNEIWDKMLGVLGQIHVDLMCKKEEGEVCGLKWKIE